MVQIIPGWESSGAKPADSSASRPLAGSPSAQPTSMSPPRSVKSTTTVTPSVSVHPPPETTCASAGDAPRASAAVVSGSRAAAAKNRKDLAGPTSRVGEGCIATFQGGSRRVRPRTVRGSRSPQSATGRGAGLGRCSGSPACRLTVAGQRRSCTGFPWLHGLCSCAPSVPPPVRERPRSCWPAHQPLRHAGGMRIYTGTGDDGSTGRWLGGRVAKTDAVVVACGDVDELVALLGVARAGCEDAGLAQVLLRLQRELFVLGADLSVNPRHRDRLEPGRSLVTAEDVAGLEQLIDECVAAHPLRPVFIVPGATLLSAYLDHARTVARRAERATLAARAARAHVRAAVAHYLNRLSDLLFVLARQAAGDAEEPASHD